MSGAWCCGARGLLDKGLSHLPGNALCHGMRGKRPGGNSMEMEEVACFQGKTPARLPLVGVRAVLLFCLSLWGVFSVPSSPASARAAAQHELSTLTALG